MMRLRAAFALLFQVLLLQVSLLGGGMACAPEWLGMVSRTPSAAAQAGPEHGRGVGHGGHRSHGAHSGGASHATHGSEAHMAAAPADAPPADHGSTPAHCAAATGCAAVAVDAPEVVTVPGAAVHATVQVGRVSLPPSIRLAPEPPPPRA
jgi:hypothetical protein